MADTLDLRTIHEALASTIRAGLSRDINVEAHPFSGKPKPLIEIWPGDPYVPFDDPEVDVNLSIRGFLATANAATAFEQMTDLLSYGSTTVNSIRDILDADPTLGSVVAAAEWLDQRWDVDRESLAQWFTIDVRIRVC